jgi:hypothetical protein
MAKDSKKRAATEPVEQAEKKPRTVKAEAGSGDVDTSAVGEGAEIMWTYYKHLAMRRWILLTGL